jgi:hypothetical protein
MTVAWLAFGDLVKGDHFRFAHPLTGEPTVTDAAGRPYDPHTKIGNGWYADASGKKWRTGRDARVYLVKD